MNLLAIDTSTETASIALLAQGVLWQEEQAAQRLHAQLILPMIAALLDKAHCELSQLDGIVFGRGPGSFTGLRIACSVAKGLAYPHDLPLFPVSSLAAIAENVFFQQQSQAGCKVVLSVLDARMNQVYWACYTDANREVTEQVSDAEDIQIADDFPLVLAGVGCSLYRPHFKANLEARIVQELAVYPHAAAMIRLVQSGKIEAVTAGQASPVYIRNQITQGEPRG